MFFLFFVCIALEFKHILFSSCFLLLQPMTDHLDGISSSSYYEYDHLFDDDPLLSSDKMVSGEPMSPAPPHIKSEHSYSLTSQPSSPLSPDFDIKQEGGLDFKVFFRIIIITGSICSAFLAWDTTQSTLQCIITPVNLDSISVLHS